jgi:cytochrome c biogenesis protein CcmG/thiol:disulfide interchange protein DsbE
VRRRRLRALALLAPALVLLTGCATAAGGRGGGASPSSSGGSDPATVHSVLQPCPQQGDAGTAGSTTLPQLRFGCLGGGTLDLAKAPGVPTVVNLWGSWCGPCREELPVLQQLADAAGGRVRVVGVISKDGVPQAESFAEDAKITFPSAFDGQGELMAKEGLNALPVSFLVDASGAVVYRQVGPVTSLAQLRQLVAAHLGVQL